jgi:hypothetical protein
LVEINEQSSPNLKTQSTLNTLNLLRKPNLNLYDEFEDSDILNSAEMKMAQSNYNLDEDIMWRRPPNLYLGLDKEQMEADLVIDKHLEKKKDVHKN